MRISICKRHVLVDMIKSCVDLSTSFLSKDDLYSLYIHQVKSPHDHLTELNQQKQLHHWLTLVKLILMLEHY